MTDQTSADSLALHEKYHGKLETKSKVPLVNRYDFSIAYSPGVGAVALATANSDENARKLTVKGNSVAVISDGSAVLGLGNIGALGALPVMEGKAAIFKELANIDAWPLVLASQNPQDTIATVRNLAPSFAGINLEDFKAPECFTIEEALQDLGIPVMHDDQHGTAIVVLAALTNALKIVRKAPEEVRIVINGAGSAGIAITKLLAVAQFTSGNIILCDTKGAIYEGREDLGATKKAEIARVTNSEKKQGSLEIVLQNADIFIGVSKGNLLTKEHIKSMARSPIVFALANPVPEIHPDLAKEAGAAIVATGRSDHPNQVNNSLAFPGVFRGAIDSRATTITTEMKLAAARALAAVIENPTEGEILPFATNPKIVSAVSAAVMQAWKSHQ